MAGYSPLHISKYETGLVQSRVEFILPNDAYPILENAFVWRERIKRKKGFRKLGQLRRVLTNISLGLSLASVWSINTIFSTAVPPIPTSTATQVEPGSVVIRIGAIVFTDNGLGVLTSVTPGNSGTIRYRSGFVTLTHTAGAGVATTIDFNYFPGLPVMGIRERELTFINDEDAIFFDTVYAYRYISGFQEFIPGTTWTGTDFNFFWSTNYWVDNSDRKIFWVTNFSGPSGDPIRYTNGVAWADFAPQINDAGDLLTQCLAMLPFRGRMVVFNTLEGQNLSTSRAFTNRIRWAAIGNPFTTVNAPTSILVVNANAWRDDIVGQGGFLDIPTSEDIISVGFVRDNLVIYCERSTWQLRYTGRSIAPFQIEKVNSELGAESTFSSVQFDTSLVGIGNRGVVQCDSFKSSLIDVKIPDLVFSFNNNNDAVKRVHGVRDFVQRLTYWTYPFVPVEAPYEVKFPNRRLVYNYENDSWAIFTDSFTTFGTFQPQESLKWEDLGVPHSWRTQNYPWSSKPAKIPLIVAGNQQGYILELDFQTTNDPSLMINNITGSAAVPPVPAIFQVIDHNLVTSQIVRIFSIPSGSYASSFNGRIGYVNVIDKDTFTLTGYDADTLQYDDTSLFTIGPGTYIGAGQIQIRDNFSVVSKKFNYANEGQNIQLGFIDILVNNTSDGQFSLNVYLDYNDSQPVNKLPQNTLSDLYPSLVQEDTFFNSIVPTTVDDLDVGVPSSFKGLQTSKSWKRVFCSVRGAFITLEWTLNNGQMAGFGQESDVEIQSQILWIRKAGNQLPIGR